MRAHTIGLLLLTAVAPVVAQQAGSRPNTVPAVAMPKVSPADAQRAAEVLAFEKNMEDAVVRGDVKYLATILPEDFTFTHGDGWTTGGAPIRVDTKASWLASVEKRPYLDRVLGPVATEVHGDIVLTYGRYTMHQRSSPNDLTSVWFERVYARRNSQWMYLSHRTVHGPTREAGPTSAR
jgi:hypothetical protein